MAGSNKSAKATSVTGTFTPSGLTIGGKITEVTVSSSSWTALPAAPLANRNGMGFQNRSSTEIRVGFDVGESGLVGWSVKPNGEFFLDVSDGVIVYAKAVIGAPVLTIMEVA